ncbi:unnamed protein product [Auanema sp. JU1783]|nr:unnamed protein product [Auanema sp. JU1783]
MITDTSEDDDEIMRITPAIRIVCGFLHVLFPTIGLLVTGTIIYSTFRSTSKLSPFNIICVCKCAVNFYICSSYLFFQAPMTFGNYIYANLRVNDTVSGIQNNLYIYLEYANVILASNRFVAIFLPTYYGRIFKPKVTLYECMFVYDGRSMAWRLFNDTPAGCEAWTTLLPFNYSLVCLTASLILNTPTFVRVVIFFTVQNGSVQESIRKNSRLFIQAVLQDLLFIMDMIFMNNLFDLFDNIMWSFFCFTLSGTLVHVLDGVLTMIFQPWILQPICVSSKVRIAHTFKVSNTLMSEKEPLLGDMVSLNSIVQQTSSGKVDYFTRRKRAALLRKYNEEREQLEEHYKTDQLLVVGQLQVEDKRGRRPDEILAKLSIGLNLILLCVNLFASIYSGSLSIISAFVDAFMDITSSAIMALCLSLINRTNFYHYPRGRAKLELVGVMICSVIMGFSNIVLFLSAVLKIAKGNIKTDVDLTIIIIMLSGSLAKTILLVLCYRRGTPASMVLALDMRNDVATALMATACAFVGANYWSYADPCGAIIVCGLISISWFRHALENVPQLVGIRADKEILSRILKIAVDHDDRIRGIDYVMVYHTGSDTLVELHIIMDESAPLKVTHDISHPLERKLMRLPFVERAFVHCDYSADGDEEGDLLLHLR